MLWWSFKVLVFLTLLLLVVLFVWQPWGYVAMRIACSESGGTEIKSVFKTNGYLHKSGGRGECRSDCIDDLVSGRFQYVDLHYPPPDFRTLTPPAVSRASHEAYLKSLPVGYWRHELLAAGDRRCDWWYRRLKSIRTTFRYGMREDQCIGHYRIDESEASRFESRLTKLKPVTGALGIGLYMNEHVIVDRQTNTPVAHRRNFGFVNSATKAMGKKTPAYRCPAWYYEIFDESSFRTQVLADERGERFEVAAAAYVAPQEPEDPDVVADESLTFTGNAVVHAVGVYRAGASPGYVPAYSGIPRMGDVVVNVTGEGKVILVLSAHDPVRWVIQPRGAQVEQVVVFGYSEQQITGVPRSTEVYVNPKLSSRPSNIYAYERDEKFSALQAAVRELTGRSIQKFHGKYDAAELLVQVGSKTGATSDVTTIEKWTDADGVVYYGDRPPRPREEL